MSRNYYSVTDWDYWEGGDRYYSNKKESISTARALFKEMKSFNAEGKIVVYEFELPKIPKGQLIVSLLRHIGFMANRKEILVLEWYFPKKEEDYDSA